MINTTKKEQNPIRGLIKIMETYEGLNLEQVSDIHQKYEYKLNKRLTGINREAMHKNEMYAVDLTSRYYRIKLGKINHDEIINSWRKEGSEIKYFRDWTPLSSKAYKK